MANLLIDADGHVMEYDELAEYIEEPYRSQATTRTVLSSVAAWPVVDASNANSAVAVNVRWIKRINIESFLSR